MMPLLDRDGRVVASRVVEARSCASRLRGWMGREDVSPGEALYLPGCASVHTCFMRIPIDVVFVDRATTVLAVRPDLAPWRFAAHVGAWGVVELPAGRAAAAGIVPGMRLSVADAEPA